MNTTDTPPAAQDVAQLIERLELLKNVLFTTTRELITATIAGLERLQAENARLDGLYIQAICSDWRHTEQRDKFNIRLDEAEAELTRLRSNLKDEKANAQHAEEVYEARLCVQPPQWVKLSERRPTIADGDASGHVLVLWDTEQQGINHVSFLGRKVTRWQRLPAPPPAPPAASKKGGGA